LPTAVSPTFSQDGQSVPARLERLLEGHIEGRAGALVTSTSPLGTGMWTFSWGVGDSPIAVEVIEPPSAVPSLTIGSVGEFVTAGCPEGSTGPLRFWERGEPQPTGARQLEVNIVLDVNVPGLTFDFWLLPAGATGPGATPPMLERFLTPTPPIQSIAAVDEMPTVSGGEDFVVAVRGVLPDGRLTEVAVAPLHIEQRESGDPAWFSCTSTRAGGDAFLLAMLSWRLARRRPRRSLN